MIRFKGKYRIPSVRLQGWDYTSPGYYFVTICTQARQPFFGEVLIYEMHLSEMGEIAHKYWVDIPHHFQYVDLDEFIIMPNHMHGIVIINDNIETMPKAADSAQHATVETQHAASLQKKPSPRSLSAIIRSYKSAVTRWAGLNGYPDFAWQARFYDHIIRDSKSLDKIRAYIRGNPITWKKDEYYPPPTSGR